MRISPSSTIIWNARRVEEVAEEHARLVPEHGVGPFAGRTQARRVDDVVGAARSRCG